MFGAAAMSLSSFCVVTNALRLNFVKVHDASKDKKRISKQVKTIIINEKKEEETIMTKTMKIEGMMCPHCENRVRKTLEAMDGIESAVVSHVEGTAVLTLTKNVDNDLLKKTIEDQGYPVLEIK